MVFGLLSGLLMDLFYSGPFGFYSLILIYIGYFNGIFTKYYYEDYITLPLILSVFNELIYCMYIYIFRFLIRGKTEPALLLLAYYGSGDYLYGCDHPAGIPSVFVSQPQTGGYRKKERLDDCLTNSMKL